MGGRINYGPSFADGEMRYLSPSTITTGDASSDGGCLRKVWFQIRLGIRSPTSKSQQVGIDLHAEIERYHLTGVKNLGPLAMSGFHAIPEPGPDLHVEKELCKTLETAPLRVAGVPLVGYIDLVHARGTNKGGTSIDDVQDPPNTVEVLDYKSTGDAKWVKSAQIMSRTPQMTSYGKWVLAVAPRTEHVRLSHLYFFTKTAAPARKVTLRVLPEQIDRQWEHVEGVGRLIVDAVRETNPDRVDANTRSCDKYGGCPARSVCSAGMHSGLRAIVGASAAQGLGEDMSIDFLSQLRGGTPSPVAASLGIGALVAPTTQPSSGFGGIIQADAAPPVPDPSIAAMAELAAEEAAAKERQDFLALATRVEAHGLGFPHLAGDAAKIYGQARGYPLTNGGYAGTGALAAKKADGTSITISDVATMAQLVVELDALKKAAPAVAAPVALLPPDAPAAAVPPPPMTIAAPPDEKPKRGKKEKPVEVLSSALPVTAAPSTGAFNLVIDAVVDASPSATSLAPLVDQLCANLLKRFADQGWQIADIRCAPSESPLGFGRWRGALAAYAREQIMEVPAGIYTLDSRGSEITEVVIEALRSHVRLTGGVFIRGLR